MKQLTPEHQVNIRCVSGIETLLSEHFGNRSSQDLNQVGMSPGMWWSRVGRVRVPHAGGDEPSAVAASARDLTCSPRRWG